MKKIALIIFSLIMVFLITGCGKEDNKEYKITIYDIDGNLYQELSSVNFQLPEMPEVEGYNFIGFREEVPNPISSDLELHPLYEHIKHTVKFMDKDGKVFLEVEVNEGDIVSSPKETPNFEKWAFDNWDFDFNTPIKSDITINGVFHQVKFSVKFYVGENLIKEELVDKGSDVLVPGDGMYDGVYAVFSIYGEKITNIDVDREIIAKTSDFNTIELYDKYGKLVYSGLEYDPIVLDYLDKGIEVPYHTFKEWEVLGTDTLLIKYQATYTISTESLSKNSSSYWIRQNAKTYDVRKVILTLDEINYINKNSIYGAYDKTKVVNVKDISEVISGSTVKSLIEGYTNITSNTVYNEDGSVNNNTSSILSNRNLDSINTNVNVKFGIVTDFGNLRSYPTNCYSKDKSKDMFQETSLNVGEGVAIYHTSLDGKWYFVQAMNYNGWIEASKVGVCSKKEMVDFLDASEFVIVIANYVSILNHHVRMGQKFPLEKEEDNKYVIKFPVRNNDGTLSYNSYKVDNMDDYHLGYLPYTMENILIQGFKILGMSYSWGDKYESGRDCSSTQNGIYSCFGFMMPRNTSNQRSIPIYSEVLSGLDSTTIVRKYNPGTLIFSSGHVMMYIGVDENSHPYILHNTTGGGANSCITQDYTTYTNKIIASLTLYK